MVATYSQDIFTIADFVRLKSQNELVIQPRFQRRAFWTPDARSYLIDTIVRALPMPKVYLRRHVEQKTRPAIYEVVDGQQRLRSVFTYLDNGCELKQKHNPSFPNMLYRDLPEPVRRAFTGYRIAVEIMEDASDSEVWGMFERLNRYTFTVNAQERRNAEFSGLFKQLSYRLAAEPSALDTWKRTGVFRDQQFARMREVEMTSDVLAAMLNGITDISRLSRVYKEFDDYLPGQDELATTFRDIIQYLGGELMEAVRATKFKLQVRTYSLMVSLADAFRGIPGGFGPVVLRSGPAISRRMVQIDDALRPAEVPPGLASLKKSLTSATSHIPERRIRNEHFINMLSLSDGDWEFHWHNLARRRDPDETSNE